MSSDDQQRNECRIRLPPTYDPHRHQASLDDLVRSELGADWIVTHVDTDAGYAFAARRSIHHEVVADTADVTIRLSAATKPSDGDSFAGWAKANYPNHELTTFEPFNNRAILSVLDSDVARCRQALATALRTKPWDLTVTAVRAADGTVIHYSVKLPTSYEPSKHRTKLLEVAQQVVGNVGWTVTDDPYRLTANLVAGTPPRFPATVTYPFDEPPTQWSTIPLGLTLDGDQAVLQLDAAPHTLVAGTTGSGKTVLVESIIHGSLTRGFELAIVDPTKGGVDFAWAYPFCRPGGWGCETLEEALTTTSIVYADGLRRKSLLKQHGAVNRGDLPDEVRPLPLLIVIDECTSLLSPESVPKGLPKTDPLVVEAVYRNGLKARLLNLFGKIARELRFVGIHLCMVSQKFYAETMSGELRANLGARILMGGAPTRGDRQMALRDPDAVPTVPAHLRDHADQVRGVGVFEVEGIGVGVFKGYHATHSQFSTRTTAAGAPTTANPRPTPIEVADHCPAPPLDDERDDCSVSVSTVATTAVNDR